MKKTKHDAHKLLHEGAVALAQVSANGMRVDTVYLDSAIEKIGKDICEIENKLKTQKIYKRWSKVYGDKFKLGSREQLGHVLFTKMGLTPAAYTESGRPSTDAEALGKVNLPFVQDYVQWTKLQKARSTYLYGLRQEVVNGYFHPVFNLNTARTFRSSSGKNKDEDIVGRDFNLQNIPNRNPMIAEIIRRCFIPRKGWSLAEVDYSQIEVRVAACYNEDPNLIQYVKDPSKCMHRDTAMQLFGLELEQVDKKTTRDWCKNKFVFPQFYGSVYFQCAPSIWEALTQPNKFIPGTNITIEEHLRKQGIKKLGDCDPKVPPKKGTFEKRCQDVERDFWDVRFKRYAEWKRERYQSYLRTGGFSTLTGFNVRGIYSRNDVINYPIQGSAFHCLLKSLTLLQKWLRKNKMRSKILGQIHDSIILDCPLDELETVIRKAKEIMTVTVPKLWDWIIVPLQVEADVSDTNWFEKKEMKL